MKKNNKKGFTLAELLIVVAIIAVLTAIAIPVFTSQLEKSRESTDVANVRNNYAEVMVGILSDPSVYSVPAELQTVTFQQRQDGWQNSDILSSLNALSKKGSNSGDLDTSIVNISGVTASGGAAFEYTKGTATTNPVLTITIS